MNNDLNNINYADIEARARMMRAVALRQGMANARKVIANAFASLFLRSSKTA